MPSTVRPIRQDATGGTSDFRVTFTLPGTDSITSLIAVAIDKLGRSQVSKPIAIRALAMAATASAKIIVKPVRDTLANGMRAVKIKLRGSTTGDYEIDNAAKQATVAIVDDE